MKQHVTATKIVVALVMTVIIIGISAFGQKDEGGRKNSFRNDGEREQDTTARRRHNGHADARNLDKLDVEMKKLDAEIKKLDIEMKKMDFSKMERNINEAISKVDFDKIGAEVESALSKIDFEKIGREIETSMQKVDWEKVNNEIKQSMAQLKEVEFPKIKLEMEKVKAELQKEGKNIKIEGEKIRADVERSMQGAKESIEKAREEIKSIRDFTNALEADGLINKKRSYKIEVKEGELFIDNKKQPQGVTDKYKQYFKKDNFKIVNEGDDRI